VTHDIWQSDFDVKYSLTETCETCITGEPFTLTTAIELEQVHGTMSLGFSGRKLSSNVRLPPSSDLNARNLVTRSSSTRSGRREPQYIGRVGGHIPNFHHRRPVMSAHKFHPMSRVVRLEFAEYEVKENPSNWKNAHLNLYDDVDEIEGHPQRPTRTLTCHQ
jgi:hypothetical protein